MSVYYKSILCTTICHIIVVTGWNRRERVPFYTPFTCTAPTYIYYPLGAFHSSHSAADDDTWERWIYYELQPEHGGIPPALCTNTRNKIQPQWSNDMSSFLLCVKTINFLDHLLGWLAGVWFRTHLRGPWWSVVLDEDKCGNSITEYYRINKTTCYTVT